MKFVTLFSGGELFGVGAREAGLTHSFGVELDPKIAAIARANRFNVYCNDVRQFQPTLDDDLFLLHASPPCQRASSALPNAKEIELDIELARATIRIIEQLRPQFFTLENVIAYKNFTAFALICEYLKSLGYLFCFWHANFADFGIPQTRRRLILIARRDGRRVHRMSSTHRYQGDMFSDPWISWGETLKDEILNLDPSPLSVKQRKKINSHAKTKSHLPILVDTRNGGQRKYTFRSFKEPCYTITATATKGHGKIRYQGEWFKMSQKAYAMIQTLPSDYKLTGNVKTNQRVIGNGVPPLFARRLCEYLIRIN